MSKGFTTWQNVLRDFVRKCEQSLPEDQAARIREARELANFALRPAPQQSEADIEEMLAARAYESAALALLTPGSGFMISRGGGESLASVVLPGSETEFTAGGKSIALAILQAHALALLGDKDQADA